MSYNFKVWNVDEKSRWIFIKSDCAEGEDIDMFIYFLNYIKDNCNGRISEVGEMRYRISGDKMDLVYQWDNCFGIVVEYSENITIKAVNRYLQKYITV